MHPRLARRTPTLLAIAGHATGDDVLPVLPAALRDRQHMIERQFVRGKPLAAILAAVIVTGVDVRAREGYVVETPLYLYISQQTDHRGHLETESDRVDLAIVHLDNL